MMKRLTIVGWVLFATGACGSPQDTPAQHAATATAANVPQAVPSSMPSASAVAQAAQPAPDPKRASVSVRVKPPGFSLDGTLDEWGSLAPANNAVADSSATPAASQIAIAVTPKGMVAALALGGLARDGIWLGIAVPAPKIRKIGYINRGGSTIEPDCDHEIVRMSEGLYRKGQPLTPQAKATCLKLVKQHAELTTASDRRFRQVFHISEGGVNVLQPDGSLLPQAGAEVRRGDDPRALEVFLPVAAMPRMVEAPVLKLMLLAQPASSAMPDLTPSSWHSVTLPQPVAYPPHAELRARAFARLVKTPAIHPSGLSYHPFAAAEVESQAWPEHGRLSVLQNKAPLFQELITMGDLTVGHVNAYFRSLAVLKNGKVVAFEKAEPPSGDIPSDEMGPHHFKRAFKRDGELHVLYYSPGIYMGPWGPMHPTWWGYIISRDGSIRPAVEEHNAGYMWSKKDEFSNGDLSRFGLRGEHTNLVPVDGKFLVKKTILWQWNASKKIYTQRAF